MIHGLKKGFKRRLIVTDEPMTIDSRLMGRPLATPWRRAAAAVVDGVAVILLVMVQTIVVNYIMNPDIVKGYFGYIGEADPALRSEKGRQVLVDVLKLANERNTGVFPEELREVIETDNDSLILAVFPETDFSIAIELDSGGESEYDPDTKMMIIRNDILNGFGNWAAAAPALLFYFTLVTWLAGGRTAGKALFGIRVVRLSGAKLTVWDSFSRAAGYAASAATFFIGFFEAFWHPNRQTVHDRIAGTVVIRTGGAAAALAAGDADQAAGGD